MEIEEHVMFMMNQLLALTLMKLHTIKCSRSVQQQQKTSHAILLVLSLSGHQPPGCEMVPVRGSFDTRPHRKKK